MVYELMAGINTVTIVGRLTKEPELRKTQSGTSYLKFTVAVDRMKKKTVLTSSSVPHGDRRQNSCHSMPIKEQWLVSPVTSALDHMKTGRRAKRYSQQK